MCNASPSENPNPVENQTGLRSMIWKEPKTLVQFFRVEQEALHFVHGTWFTVRCQKTLFVFLHCTFEFQRVWDFYLTRGSLLPPSASAIDILFVSAAWKILLVFFLSWFFCCHFPYGHFMIRQLCDHLHIFSLQFEKGHSFLKWCVLPYLRQSLDAFAQWQFCPHFRQLSLPKCTSRSDSENVSLDNHRFWLPGCLCGVGVLCLRSS